MTSDNNDQFAGTVQDDDEERNDENNGEGDDNESSGLPDFDEMDVTDVSVDELFATLRLERQDNYNEMKEQLSAIVASSSSTTDQINEAMEKINDLQATARKESYLEKIIMQEKGYKDVLVRKEDDFISITVIANELSKSDANNIMQLARDEFGVMDVRVSFRSDDA